MSIATNYQEIRSQVPPEVTIVVAAKTRQSSEIAEIISAGARHIGHNYVQEAQAMALELPAEVQRQVCVHLIGHLQTKKINKALDLFGFVQTVDGLSMAAALSERACRRGILMPVLLEINSAREKDKSGMAPDPDLVMTAVLGLQALPGIQLKGLMTMGPFDPEPERMRPYFRLTADLFSRIRDEVEGLVGFDTLSMGMSDSWKVAIEEGSTMIRLGTILFGLRS